VKTLEDMIRAASHATADEIDPAQLPALRLAGTRARAGSRRGGLRHARMRRWVTPLAAAAAAVAIVVSAAVVSSGPGRSPGMATTALDRKITDYLFPATGAEFTTGAQIEGVIFARGRDSEASCLARLGYHIPRVSPRAAAAADWALTQLPDLARIRRTASLGPADQPFPFNQNPIPRRDLRRCQSASIQWYLPTYRAYHALARSWSGILTRTQTTAPVRATLGGLRACAQRYGARPSSIGSLTEFADWVLGHINGSAEINDSPARTRALERHWAPIFITCARPTVSVQERLQSAQRVIFLHRHRGQVLTLIALMKQALSRPGASEHRAP
jgi:hypothetical protein